MDIHSAKHPIHGIPVNYSLNPAYERNVRRDFNYFCPARNKNGNIRIKHRFNYKQHKQKMNKEEIRKGVFQYVYDNAFSSKENITDDVLIFKNGFLDSMGLVMLITYLEDTFSIKTIIVNQ